MAAAPPSYDEANKYGNQAYTPHPNDTPYPNQAPYPSGAPYPNQAPYPTGAPYPNQAPYPTGAPYNNQPQQNVVYPAYPDKSYQAGISPYQGNEIGGPVGDQSYDDGFASFSDKSIRRAFIRKVYLIMTAQLLVTCAFIALLQFVKPVQIWVKKNMWFYILSYVVFIITYIALVCCPSVRRKYPGNFICLAVFTFAFSYLTGTIASYYDTPAVLSAAGITTVVCLSITIFALQTKIDFTMCSGLILVISLVFLLTGLSCMIIFYTVGYSKVLHGVYAGIGILLFGVYLIYDTQMIVGGGKYELGAEDYIEGALQLYLDIVNMFLLILSLFGSKN